MKRDRYRSSVITKKEKAFLLFLACCLILFVMFSNRLRIIATITKNQLAQIIAIETDLLKKWSQGGGLKSNLTLHSQGKEVYLLQSMLMQDSELYLGKKATGYFGKLTQQAVIQFQKEYGITETGWVDEDTRKKLNKIFLTDCVRLQQLNILISLWKRFHMSTHYQLTSYLIISWIFLMR